MTDTALVMVGKAERQLTQLRNEARNVARHSGNDELTMFAEDLMQPILKLREALEP